MKFIKTISILGFITSTLFTVSAVPGKKPTFSSDLVGPTTGEKDFHVNFYSTMNTYEGHANLSYIGPGSIYAVRAFTVATPASGLSTPMELTIEGRMSTGVKIDLTIDTRNFQIYLYKPVRNAININRYRNGLYQTEHHFFKISRNQVLYTESFDFQETTEYISCDRGNKLVLSDIYFSYLDFPFTAKKASLVINDYYKIYPALHTNSATNLIDFPLMYEQDSEKITFSSMARLYVNPTTLDLRPFKTDGYVSTRDIYVPIGKEDKLANTEIYIRIEEAGYGLTTITIPLQFSDFKQLFGFCYESDFCIEGGIKG